MKEYIMIIIAAVLVNNFVLVRFLGICPFLGVSKKTETALGMGFAVMFVMTLASLITYVVNELFLIPTSSNLLFKVSSIFSKNIKESDFNFQYLQTIVFILTIATLVQLVEMAIKKYSPILYQSLGIFLPLITTNCAVLGVSLINVQTNNFNLVKAVLNGFSAATGFTLALLIMSGLRERLEYSNVPKALKGVPIALITGGILSLCFMGFSGIK